MVLEKNNEQYLLFDRFVTSLNEGAMPWLFKVYLENNYKILSEEKEFLLKLDLVIFIDWHCLNITLCSLLNLGNSLTFIFLSISIKLSKFT